MDKEITIDKDITMALEKCEMVYADLVEIANEMIGSYTKEVDAVIREASGNIENLSNENIRALLLKISLKAYSFSEIKEKSAFKAECAETLRKEAYAKAFNMTPGATMIKTNMAVINASAEMLSETIYKLVADLFKTKLDELHRVCDSLRSVLSSRVQEMKLSSNYSVGTPGEKTYLTE